MPEPAQRFLRKVTVVAAFGRRRTVGPTSCTSGSTNISIPDGAENPPPTVSSARDRNDLHQRLLVRSILSVGWWCGAHSAARLGAASQKLIAGHQSFRSPHWRFLHYAPNVESPDR